MKQVMLFVVLGMFALTSQGQTVEELKALKSQKQDSIDALQSEVDDLTKRIDQFPGWKFGAIATVGFNVSQFSNWYAQGSPNVDAGKIGIGFSGYANLDREKYFWRNSMTVNLQWVKFDDKDDPDDVEGYREATDVFNINSLYGYKLSDKLALSALGEYRTTLLSNFNDPGYLDLGVGFTWTPVNELVVVVHPLNYNFVFSDDDDIFESSAGCKIMADYIKDFGGLKFKSNFSGFLSYKDSNYSNWTWTNSLGYSLWKNIGLGFEFALRDNKQEALNYAINSQGIEDATFDNIDNDLQSYWLFGLNYSF
ncbi:DUF3078 domain-containing protein [Robertkochia sediminum]|uniref:DUF3078 domain-containing protein n=1 Tax=Robertkochia sediminum TaxID=2785326 RepID=UPI0019326A79|nr:DUF3078 domain-containing protein [Robertkochia sediminum]MBL7471828.1 DUF3078 domain-containing protein [Robertkochia sediminum]